jgi:hypothetical protein
MLESIDLVALDCGLKNEKELVVETSDSSPIVETGNELLPGLNENTGQDGSAPERNVLDSFELLDTMSAPILDFSENAKALTAFSLPECSSLLERSLRGYSSFVVTFLDESSSFLGIVKVVDATKGADGRPKDAGLLLLGVIFWDEKSNFPSASLDSSFDPPTERS